MPHIYIPEMFVTQDEYDMIHNNLVPIDTFVANKIRQDDMFVYVQERDANYTRAENYEWSPELESRVLSGNPDKRSTICDI